MSKDIVALVYLCSRPRSGRAQGLPPTLVTHHDRGQNEASRRGAGLVPVTNMATMQHGSTTRLWHRSSAMRLFGVMSQDPIMDEIMY